MCQVSSSKPGRKLGSAGVASRSAGVASAVRLERAEPAMEPVEQVRTADGAQLVSQAGSQAAGAQVSGRSLGASQAAGAQRRNPKCRSPTTGKPGELGGARKASGDRKDRKPARRPVRKQPERRSRGRGLGGFASGRGAGIAGRFAAAAARLQGAEPAVQTVEQVGTAHGAAARLASRAQVSGRRPGGLRRPPDRTDRNSRRRTGRPDAGRIEQHNASGSHCQKDTTLHGRNSLLGKNQSGVILDWESSGRRRALGPHGPGRMAQTGSTLLAALAVAIDGRVAGSLPASLFPANSPRPATSL